MANANVPRGLVPYAHYDGSVWNGSANIYYVAAGYATALYIGDPVVTHSASNDANGVPAVQLGASGSPIVGSVVGIVNGGPLAAPIVTVTRDLPIYHPASTAQYILVADDPTLLFWIQDDASTQSTYAPNLWSGKNANLVSGTGSTTTGYSGWQLQASSVATTNTLDLKIMRALNQADNVIGTTANTNMNAKWLVKCNNYQYEWQTAGV
jgi:hypothetical protein